MENLFLQASKKKLRFTTNKGQISTEELWDLNLPSLDNIAKDVFSKVQASQVVSFIDEKTTSDKDSELRLEILKFIIAEKKSVAEKAKERARKEADIARITELIAEKNNEALKGKSVEELQKELETLRNS